MIGASMAVRAPRTRGLGPMAMDAIRRNNGTLLMVPDNLAGAFIDSTGTQPVTAVGDVLGLLTDRSYGAGNLGPNVFNDAAVVFGGESSRVSPGVYRIYSSAGTYSAMTQAVGSIGKTYKIGFTVDSVISAGGGIGLDAGGVAVTTFAATVGRKEAIFTYASTVAWSIKRAVGVTDIQISNIRVEEVLGNHASQGTTASKPLVAVNAQGKKVLSFDGSNDFLQTGITTGNEGWVCAGVTVANHTSNQSLFGNGAGGAEIKGVWVAKPSGVSAYTFNCSDGAGGVRDTLNTVAITAGVPSVLEFGWTPTTMLTAVNGSVTSRAKTKDVTHTAGLVLGGFYSWFHSGPSVGYVLTPVLPSESDRALIRRWIGSLQGQTL